MPWVKDNQLFSEQQIRDAHPMTAFSAVNFASDVQGFGYVWEAPGPSPEPTERRIQAWEFRDRFTEVELDGVMDAADAGDKIARRMLLKIQTASDGVNLLSPEVIAGLDYLIYAGVLTLERKAEILA